MMTLYTSIDLNAVGKHSLEHTFVLPGDGTIFSPKPGEVIVKPMYCQGL